MPQPDTAALNGTPVDAPPGDAQPTAAAMLAELRCAVSNRIKAGTSQQVLFVAPAALTDSDACVEALHQLLVASVLPGLVCSLLCSPVIRVSVEGGF